MVGARSCAPAQARPDRRQVEQTLLALYALGLRRGACSTSSSRTCWTLRVRQAARAQLAEAGDGARPRCGRRSGWRPPGRSCSSSWPTPRWRARRGWSWAGSATRCCRASGWPSRWSFAFSFAYVASERDKKVDLAYFRTSRPGEVTRRIVRNLDQPIEVAVVLPGGERGARRGRRLPQRSGQGVEPAQGHALRLRHRSRSRPRSTASPPTASWCSCAARKHEQLGLPKEIEGAKPRSRRWTRRSSSACCTVVKPPRTVGFTLGHGERTWERGETDTDKRAGHRDSARRAHRSDLRRALRSAPPTA